MKEDLLYLIIPYYDYFNNQYRLENLIKTIDYYSNFKRCKTIIVEGIIEGGTGIQDLSSKVFKHIKYTIPQKIWVKENLLNLAIQNHLPEDFKYFCWLDGDVLILDDYFAEKTILLLERYDIIQMFQFAINLKYVKTPNNKIISWTPFEVGFVYFNLNYQEIINNNSESSLYKSRNLQKTTGFAWSMTRSFYEKIGGFPEFNIVGGGDTLIAKSSLQLLTNNQIIVEKQLNYLIYSEKYGQDILDFYNKFKNCKASYLDSVAKHLPHGDFDSRKYMDRHRILEEHNFDKSMLSKTDEGVIVLNNKQILEKINQYLENRESNTFIV